MKTMITVYLDGELVTEARIKGIKFSQEFNNHLRALLEMEEEDADAPMEDRIVNAKARLMSLEADKKKAEVEHSKRFINRREL